MRKRPAILSDRWGRPQLTKSKMFDTPTDWEDLFDYIDGFSGGEKVAAMVCAHMAWNVAAEITKACDPDYQPEKN